jgi:uncharacterized damage-inducible protein DinB
VHPHLSEVLRCLDESRATLRAAVDDVPEHRRRTRPAPGRWSVAEVLEHLALVDRFFAERMVEAITTARAEGLPPEDAPRVRLPEQVTRQMADREDPREAREAMQPTGALGDAEAWEALDAAREAVRTAALNGDGLALGRVTSSHRFFGTLTVYQWVELTAAHEVRHADQIREIGQAVLDAPSP